MVPEDYKSDSPLDAFIFPPGLAKGIQVIQTKIKGGCQSGRKVVPHNSKSDLPLVDQNIV